MAEIRVQPKPRSRAWLWLLLVVAVAALVAWYLLREGVVSVQPTGALPAAVPALAAALAGGHALAARADEPAPARARVAAGGATRRAPRA